MDLLRTIAELREEWQRLTNAIAALERLAGNGKQVRSRRSKSLDERPLDGGGRSAPPAFGTTLRKGANPGNLARLPSSDEPKDQPSEG